MAYAPEVHKLYVSDEHGDIGTVIDMRTNTQVATFPLGGEIWNTQHETVSKHVFANVQTQSGLLRSARRVMRSSRGSIYRAPLELTAS